MQHPVLTDVLTVLLEHFLHQVLKQAALLKNVLLGSRVIKLQPLQLLMVVRIVVQEISLN